MEFLFVYVTTSSKEEAKKIGKILVQERLAACVNILDQMNSIYWWEGKVHEDTETVMIAKTRASLLDKLTCRVKEIHSYKCPCVVALPIVGGNQDYLDWLQAETME